MLVENTEANRKVQEVAATMAIEGMYLDKAFIIEMLKVANGEKTSEDLRQELLSNYSNRHISSATV